MESIKSHQAVFLETNMSYDDNVILSDWIASGVDDIFTFKNSEMICVVFNDGNELWLTSKETK